MQFEVRILERFKNFISEKKLFNPEDYILLGVSGGIDSVVICELFHIAKFRFAIAHCNFQLRGKESDADEKFVRILARKYKVPFFSKKFNASGYAKKKGVSIQMAARELRYEWFGEAVSSWQLTIGSKNTKKKTRPLPSANCILPTFYIAIATQLNDEIETMLINITRGTGISGLHGILPKKEKIIRPLLFATRNEILVFAAEKNLSWREDSSNISDKYTRNKIRHKIIPVLKEINPEIEQTISENINRIRETEEIFHQRIEEKRKEIFITPMGNSGILLPIEKLSALTPLNTYLFEFLNPYGFNEKVITEIIPALRSQPGKKFFSATHCIFKDRKFLILKKRTKPVYAEDINKDVCIIENNTKQISAPITVRFRITDKKNFRIIKDEKIACLDYDKLKFPLVIRTWKEGDSFIPFGMKGRKKLSDFLTDKKIPLAEKEKIYVLISFGKIIWVIGNRIDELFKVSEETRKVFIARLL